MSCDPIQHISGRFSLSLTNPLNKPEFPVFSAEDPAPPRHRCAWHRGQTQRCMTSSSHPLLRAWAPPWTLMLAPTRPPKLSDTQTSSRPLWTWGILSLRSQVSWSGRLAPRLLNRDGDILGSTSPGSSCSSGTQAGIPPSAKGWGRGQVITSLSIENCGQRNWLDPGGVSHASFPSPKAQKRTPKWLCILINFPLLCYYYQPS